jgi:hypothetical protein
MRVIAWSRSTRRSLGESAAQVGHTSPGWEAPAVTVPADAIGWSQSRHRFSIVG